MWAINQIQINHQNEIGAMTWRAAVLLASTLFLAGALLVGCAAEPTAKSVSQSSVLAQRSVSSRDAENLAFAYRRQAKILREVASRLEAEATLYQQRLGAAHEWARQSREAANATWAAAEEADEMARSYQRQVPNGRVY